MQPGYAPPAPGSNPACEVLDRLRAALDEKTYGHWIDGKVVLTTLDDELTVGVGSPFLLAWMQRQFGAVFRSAAKDVLGPSTRLRYVVDGRLGLPAARATNGRTSAPTQPDAETRDDSSSPSAASLPARTQRTESRSTSAVSERRRFADLGEFVVGPNSELAFAAAQRFCVCPTAAPSPLYLFGGVGLGKTHLLEGIVKSLRQSAGAGQVAYFTAESFANYFTEALRSRTLAAFRNRFRGVNVLVVDDIDFFDGKKGLQEEFLHTIQHLESRGRSIVVAADRHPKLLTRTSDELVTRFLSGTVCRLESPGYETRLRILEQKSSRLSEKPSAAVFEYIASKFRGGVRELEGALNCLDVFRSLSGRPVGVTAARQVLGDLERDCLRAIRLPDIERAVCEFFGVEPAALRSAKRSRSVSQPRMLAMYLARKHTQAAYGEIGAHFGGRNHSTVIAADRKMRQLLEQSPSWHVASESMRLQDVVQSIESCLRAS
jgi:chromosomal replication initiator protein